MVRFVNKSHQLEPIRLQGPPCDFKMGVIKHLLSRLSKIKKTNWFLTPVFDRFALDADGTFLFPTKIIWTFLPFPKLKLPFSSQQYVSLKDH